MRKSIIVLGAGPMQVPAILTARGLGLFVIAADRDSAAEGMSLADFALNMDIKDHDALSSWAAKHAREHSISAVFAGADVAVTAAAVNERLGLPGIPMDVAVASHNKAIMKRKWLEDGVPTPCSFEVQTQAQADDAAGKIGYPLIVKAVDNSASRGTRVVETPEEFPAAVENAKAHSGTGSCLVEEFVTGEEQSVETIMHEGRQLRAGIVDRHFGFFPYNIETGHTNPTKLSEEVQEQIYRVVEQAALSLGIVTGAAKADMILTRKGPMILEMPARLSGGFHSQYTTPLALGTNPIRAAMRQALGDEGFREDLIVTRNRYSRCQAIFPAPGRIKNMAGYHEALAVDGVHKIFLFKKRGDEISDYRTCADRPCYVIMSADHREELQDIFAKVCSALRFEME